METSVVLDTATSNMASPPAAVSPVAKAVLSKMTIVSDEVCNILSKLDKSKSDVSWSM